MLNDAEKIDLPQGFVTKAALVLIKPTLGPVAISARDFESYWANDMTHVNFATYGSGNEGDAPHRNCTISNFYKVIGHPAAVSASAFSDIALAISVLPLIAPAVAIL